MLRNMKKKYLQKIMILGLFCAVLLSIPLFIASIKYEKLLIGVFGVWFIFVIAAIPAFIGNFYFKKIEKSILSQIERYSIDFSDTEAELLSNNGNVYLSENWLINLPHWALFREHITEFTYEKFNGKSPRYGCFIHTADDVNYMVWLESLKSVEKIEKWVAEK